MRPGVALTLLVASACAAGRGRDSDPAGPVGCYQFRWDASVSELRLPWGFELLDAPLEGWSNVPEGRRARTRASARTVRDIPFAFWVRAAGDSVVVGHPGGGGVSLRLVRRGPDLAGVARASGDAVPFGGDLPPPVTRPVLAYRVLCPSVASP